MPRAIKTTAKTASTTEVQRGRLISLGRLWETSDSEFYAGKPEHANGRYSNQEEALAMLPPAAEGFHWEIKGFVDAVTYQKDGKEITKTVMDIIFQEERNKRDA